MGDHVCRIGREDGPMTASSQPSAAGDSSAILIADVRARAAPVVAAVGFLLALQYAYVHFLAVTFNYLGYSSRSVAPEFFYPVVVGTGLLTLALPRSISRASDFMLWASYVLIFAPSITIAHYSTFIESSELARYDAVVASCFLLAVAFVRGAPQLRFYVIGDTRIPVVMIAGISIVTYGILFASTGFHIRLTSLTDVQQLRFGYRDLTQSGGGLIGYLLPPQAYVVNPVVICWGIYRRKPFLVLAGVFGQLILYSIGGHRVAILSPIAILAIYYAFRKQRLPKGALVLYGMLGLVLLQVALSSLNAMSQVTLMIQRLIVFPPPLVAATVGFFDHQSKAHWAYSFMSPFIHYQYSSTPNFLVGASLGNAQNSANSNLLGDGFANLGYPGMVLETVVFAILLWLLDITTARLPVPVVCCILILPAVAFANVSAFTAILTQGVLLAIVISALLPRDGWVGPIADEGVSAPTA